MSQPDAQPKFYRNPSLSAQEERPAYRPAWDARLVVATAALLAAISVAILMALPDAGRSTASGAPVPAVMQVPKAAASAGLTPLSPRARRELLAILTRE